MIGSVLGRLQFLLELDADRMAGGLMAAEGKVKRFEETSNHSFMGIGAMAGVLAGGAIVGIAVAATKMASDFQGSMTQLVTGAGEAEGAIGGIRKGVLAMSGEVGTAPQELAKGLYMIESAGFHGNDALALLRTTSIAAKVGMADFSSVADATTSALNSYGMKGVDAQKVTDILLQTVSEGKMHFGDLASSIGSVLPIAATAGISLKDIGAAMATMTMQGVSAQDAAMKLRMSITALEAPNHVAAKAMKEFGLNSSEINKILKQPGGLATTFELITESVGKKFPAGSAQYIDAIKNIMGGSRNMQAALLLTGTHMSAFKDNLKGMADASRGAGKTMEGWAITQKDAGVAFDRLKNGALALAIGLATNLLPYVTKGASAIADIISKIQGGMSPVKAIGDAIQSAFGPGPRAIFDAIAGIVGGLVSVFKLLASHMEIVKPVAIAILATWLAWKAIGLVSMLVEFGGAFLAFAGEQGIAAAAATALGIAEMLPLWPLLLIAVAIGAAIAIGYLLITHWKDVSKVAGQVGNAIKTFFIGAFHAVEKAIGDAIAWIGQELPKLPEQIGEALGKATYWLLHFVTTDLPKMAMQFTSWWNKLPGFVWDALYAVMANVSRWLADAIPKVEAAAVKFALAFTDEIRKLPGQVLELGGQIISGLIKGLLGGLGALGNAITTIKDKVLGGFIKGFIIHSPAQLMVPIGRRVTQGLGVGIEQEQSAVQAVSRKVLQLQAAGGGAAGSGPAVGPRKGQDIHIAFNGDVKPDEGRNLGRDIAWEMRTRMVGA